MREWRSFIDGESRGESDRRVILHRPGTEDPCGVLIPATEREILAASSSTAKAFEAVKSLTSYERRVILEKASRGVAHAAEELTLMLVQQAGKPIQLARGEVERCIETLRLSSAEAERLNGSLLPLDQARLTDRGRFGITKRFPLGPVLGITPFNFPLNLVAHKVGPALAAGNSILIKPSGIAPGPAVRLAEILLEAGVPAGAVNVILAEPKQMDPLIFDDKFKMITFTGSAPVGWGIKAKSGRKRVTLELGGNGAAIVHSDADLDHALERCVSGAFAYMGQVCISLQRLYVHRPIMVSFAKRLAERIGGLMEGDPLDEKTMIAPMISDESAARVEEWIHEAVVQGARILCGGARRGALHPATLITDVDPGCRLYSEEIFGPVLILDGYDTMDEAIKKVNASRYGLQAGIFTRDIERILYAHECLEVGSVIANDVPSYRSDAMPYGGVKESGIGREGVSSAVREMTEERLLVINRMGLPEAY